MYKGHTPIGVVQSGPRIFVTRRQTLLFGSSLICFLHFDLHTTLADAEHYIEVPDETGSQDQKEQEEITTELSPSQAERVDEPTSTETGISYREPTCGLYTLTTHQSLATNTPTEPPGYLSSSSGSYFSDNQSRSFLAGAPDCIERASKIIESAGKYHLFNRPTALPRGQSVDENVRKLFQGIDKATLSGRTEALIAAVQLVRNSGFWNYKSTFGSQWENAGNFNFGYAFAAVGVPEEIALRGAGAYGTYFGQWDPSSGHWFDLSGSFGDDPRDQEQIRNGYDYYKNRELIDILYNDMQPRPGMGMGMGY
ncbi:polymorphic toxin type 44 domain-containing protein [Mesorhizobium sp. BHbdii]